MISFYIPFALFSPLFSQLKLRALASLREINNSGQIINIMNMEEDSFYGID